MLVLGAGIGTATLTAIQQQTEHFFIFVEIYQGGVLFQFFKIFLSCHVGSIAEEIKGSEKMKNTSAVFNPKGKLIGKYTKVSNWGTS